MMSGGLWQQLQHANKRIYTPDTSGPYLGDFAKIFQDMEWEREQARLMTILKCYIDAGVQLEEHELRTITLMITSTDEENRILAETILEEKLGRKITPPIEEESDRQVVVHTGEKGAQMINQLMKKQCL